MRQHPIPAWLPLAAAVCLVSTGCSESAPATQAVAEAGATGDTSAIASQTSREGALTSIDAALGDGAAMPPDSRAPSAYDLAMARAAPAAPSDPRPATLRSAAVQPGATDLVPAEDAVTSGG